MRAEDAGARARRFIRRDEEPEPEPTRWAFIDTAAYWDAGLNKVGTFGKVDFMSDKWTRDLTERYRNGKASPPGIFMPDNFFIIRVKSQIQDEWVYALYDDAANTILFDHPNVYDFCDRLDIYLISISQMNDLIEMARRLKEKEGKK